MIVELCAGLSQDNHSIAYANLTKHVICSITLSNRLKFLNFCYSSTIQMVWFILIHVIIEVIYFSLTSKAFLSRQVHFDHFSL